MIRFRKHLSLVGPLTILVLAISLYFWQQATVYAQTERDNDSGQDCIGLDILFLIDQSDSMLRNDRSAIRKSAVDTVINILGDNAVYFCPGVKHRIAVLGFGQEDSLRGPVQLYLDENTIIAPSLENLRDWVTQREAVLKPSVPITDTLGKTDHRQAFAEAAPILKDWLDNPLDNLPRRRGVVMVTDGDPCLNYTDDRGCYWDDTDYLSLNDYLVQLEQDLDPVLSDAYSWRGGNHPESTYIWIVTFRDSYDFLANRPGLKRSWEKIAELHGGGLLEMPTRSSVSESNLALTQFFSGILRELLVSRLETLSCDQPLWISPYTSDVTIIHIFRQGADEGVDIKDVRVSIKLDQGDEEVTILTNGSDPNNIIDVEDYTPDGLNERYVLRQPPPGRYTVQVENADLCQDLIIEYGQIGVSADLLSPSPDKIFATLDADHPFYNPALSAPFSFQFTMQEQEGDTRPLVQQASYPLTVTVNVYSDPTHNQLISSYNLQEVIPSSGNWTSVVGQTSREDLIEFSEPGTYYWEMVAQTRNPRSFLPSSDEEYNNTPISVVTASGSMIAKRGNPFSYQIVTPHDNALRVLTNDNLSGHLTLEIELQVTDSSGFPLNPNEVFLAESNTFQIELIDPSGQQIPIQQSYIRPDFNSGTITASASVSLPQEVEEIIGQYELKISLLPNFDIREFLPTELTRSISFELVESVEFIPVIEPGNSTIIPLIEGQEKTPLEVKVLLYDPVSETSIDIESVYEEVFVHQPTVTLMDAEQTTAIDTEVLLAKGAELVASFHTKDDDYTFEPICYVLDFDLTGVIESDVFIPQVNKAQSEICFRLVERFDWSVTAPLVSEAYPLYSSLGWNNEPEGTTFEIKIGKSDTGQELSPTDVFISLATPVITGKLVETCPSGGGSFDIQFFVDENTQRLNAKWPDDAWRAGTYTLEQVTLTNNSWNEFWSPESLSHDPITFTTTVDFLSTPKSLESLIWGLAGLTLLAISFFATWNCLRGGELVFMKDSQEIDRVRTYRWYWSRSFSGATDIATRPNAIVRIAAKCVRPTVDGARIAADITLVYEGSEDGPSFILNEGEDAPIGGGNRAKLEKNHSGKLPLWWPLSFIIIVAAWVIYFVLLYQGFTC